MRVLLMNPNANTATTEAMCAIAARVLPQPPVSWTAPDGPRLLTTPEVLDLAATSVERATLPDDLDAVIVSAFGDPGAAALAQRLAIPVIGIGAASARACTRPFAVATTTPALATRIDALMTAQNPEQPYLGCFLTNEDPDALMADTKALDAALIGAIRHAATAGAEQVIIGGGPLGEAALRLSTASPVPLIHPILAAAQEALDRLT